MTRLLRIPQAGVSSIVDLIGRLRSQIQPSPQGLQVPWFADHNETLPLVLVVALHVCVWWAVALLLHAPSDIHNDMAEAFSWGRELQWGYYKHPPFWAWIARAWFSIFPATDWAFYLLSVVNSAVGLIGVWAIAGRYVTGARRLAAVVLLELVPFYHLLAFTYNANSIALSVWPWAIYAFIVSFETRRLVPAASFGALAAAAMLSKYFGGVLLVSCLGAAIASPLARAYFRSAAPYVTILVFGACVAPHVAWLLEVSSGPIDYLSTKTEYSFLFVAGKAATVVAGIILQHGFLVVVLVALRRTLGEPAWGLASASPRALIGRPKIRLLAALAVAPVLVTVLVSLLGNVRLSTKFALPLFSLMPLVWIIFDRAKCGFRSMCAVGFSIGLVMGGALLLALPAADLKFKHNHRHFAEPRAIVARQLTELWHAQMASPLRIVAGTESYALATTFYSDDHPSHFIDFSTTRAPWIDNARLSRDGLAIICVSDDKACLDETDRFKSLRTTRVTLSNVFKSFLGSRGKAFSFVVVLVHPGQIFHAPAIDCCTGPLRGERNGLGAGNCSGTAGEAT
ncbi:glycosyltransferase family 39 protein [Bradyrhizobium liaoningense]|uniref:glycosyltransferase family 39 protein n=1 Tax=Bradyrhizobium liaoningense TaxID=43992 RepID=UPI001BA5D2B5|nr:glycosyltransferase family 39 protein [Bradyrhizobium liaoningense]MBR0843297.1 glycosyltransferase family 39 protein [Bradyrhizobium liaoningense]